MIKKYLIQKLIHKNTMEKNELTKKEKMMLYGLVKYPNLTDKKISEKLNLKHSTVTSIRHRLKENKFYRRLIIPSLESMGCNMLVVIYTNFSPLIPLEERVKITGKTIEVFDEIFFSVGEQDKGLSLSLSKDYATIGRINDIRTKTFGGRGLLEEQYPYMIVFPFEISKIYRFFDYAPLLKSSFNIQIKEDDSLQNLLYTTKQNIHLSQKESNVYCMLIGYPQLSDSDIGKKLHVSRHTISRLRRDFEKRKLLRKINLPDIKNLGFEIIAFYHILFDPRNHPDMEKEEAYPLMNDSTIFFARRMFEAFILSVYTDYADFNKDKTRIMQTLKENKWIAKDPLIWTCSLRDLIYIKDFMFAPITKKITGCTLEL